MPVVTTVSTAHSTLALRERFTTAVRFSDAIDALAIEIHTDDGRSGIGMATATPAITQDTVAGMEAFVADLVRPLVVGRPVDDGHADGHANGSVTSPTTSARG